jgi:hypothetical protein
MEGAPGLSGSRSLAKEKPTETPSSKTEVGQQHLAQFNNKKKKTTNIAQFEHKTKIHRTSALLCSQAQSVSKKKTWPFIPCRLSSRP